MRRLIRHKATGHLKEWIARTAGLSVADAVNVAIFALTLVSLVLAGAGVVVAYWTLKDAHESGEQQKKDLADERSVLQQLQGGISAQEKTLSDNLSVAENQQKMLNKTIEVATGQLKVMQELNT